MYSSRIVVNIDKLESQSKPAEEKRGASLNGISDLLATEEDSMDPSGIAISSAYRRPLRNPVKESLDVDVERVSDFRAMEEDSGDSGGVVASGDKLHPLAKRFEDVSGIGIMREFIAGNGDLTTMRTMGLSWCTVLLVAVALGVMINSLQAPTCYFFGKSGLACNLTSSGCLLPSFICTDLSVPTRAMAGRTRLATTLAVTSASRAVTTFTASTMDQLRRTGYNGRPGYAAFYADMERTRQKSLDVRHFGRDMLSKVPTIAMAVGKELKIIRARVAALEQLFDKEREATLQFFISLDESIAGIVDLIESEVRVWQDFQGELQLLVRHSDDLLTHRDTFVDAKDIISFARRTKVLVPNVVPKVHQVAGGAIRVASAAVITWGACMLFPALKLFAAPVASALTLSFSWLAHTREPRLGADYYQNALAHYHEQSFMSTIKFSLPSYLVSVTNTINRTRNVARYWSAVRGSIGNAEIARSVMMENRVLTRISMLQFIRFIDSAIADMQGVNKLALFANLKLIEFMKHTNSQPLGMPVTVGMLTK